MTLKKSRKKTVVLGMSGGVDSSVAVSLLQKQGYDVVGVFLHFWKETPHPSPLLKEERGKMFENKCCSLESQEEARRVAQIMGIPFYTANASKEFKKEVVDYFLKEYKAGRTPNPCVVCNREIKFKALFKKMLELDADFVATGHYARIKRQVTRNKEQGTNKTQTSNYKLHVAVDKEKDQTYFLYTLTQEQLKQVLFPVGEYTKPEIRKMAEKLKLPVFSKKDSQDVCFIPDSTNEFLKRRIKMKPGNIVDLEGKILACHEGLPLYTIGQRKGINIGGQGPYFVVEKNSERNEIIVTNNQKDERIFSKKITIDSVNWINEPTKYPATVYVKTRYRNPAVCAKITPCNVKHVACNKGFFVIFDEVQRAITPGQSAVFYSKKGEVLGGGVISQGHSGNFRRGDCPESTE